MYNKQHRKWTAINAFRDTEAEREFAKKSLPSVLSLKPDELIVGIDPPSNDTSHPLEDYIRDICKPYSQQTKIKIIIVAKSPEWNLQVGNIFYRMIKESSNPCICTFDIDAIINKNMLLALSDLGYDNMMVVSFNRDVANYTLIQKLRHFMHNFHIKKYPITFAGCYWIYQPYYLELIDKKEFQKIYNGFDTFMKLTIDKQKKYKRKHRSIFGMTSLDVENEDKDWRQFLDGVFYLYNKKRIIYDLYAPNTLTNKLKIKSTQINVMRHIISHCIINVYPYFFKGVLFAILHPNHKIKELVNKYDEIESFQLLGSKPLELIPEITFKRKGTGFIQ